MFDGKLPNSTNHFAKSYQFLVFQFLLFLLVKKLQVETLSGKLGSFRLYLRDEKPCSKIEGEADFKPDRPKKDSLKMIAPRRAQSPI